MSFLDDPKYIEASKAFVEAADSYQKEADELYAALPHDDRLKIFCAVMKLLVEGELERKGTYRYVLYDVFNFDVASYSCAQHAGYLQLHNAIYDYDEMHSVIKQFVEEHMDVTKDDLNTQITDYLNKKLFL